MEGIGFDGFQCCLCESLFASFQAFNNHKRKNGCSEAQYVVKKIQKKPESLAKQRLRPDDLELVSSAEDPNVSFAVKFTKSLETKEEKEKEKEKDLDADEWAQKQKDLLDILSWTVLLDTPVKRAELCQHFGPIKKEEREKHFLWKGIMESFDKTLAFAAAVPALLKNIIVAEGGNKPKQIWKFPKNAVTLERRRQLYFDMLYWMYQKKGEKSTAIDITLVDNLLDNLFSANVEEISSNMQCELFLMAMLCKKAFVRSNRQEEKSAAAQMKMIREEVVEEEQQKVLGNNFIFGIGSSWALDKLVKDMLWLLQLYALTKLKITHSKLDYGELEFVNDLSLGFNSYSCLRNILHQNEKLMKKEQATYKALATVVPKDPSNVEVLVEGQIMHANFLPTLYKKLMHQCKLKIAWLCGVEDVDKDLELTFDHITDNLTFTTVSNGLNFYDFTFANPSLPKDKDLASCWQRCLTKHPKLVCSDGQNFDVAFCKKWFKEADDLIQLFLVLIHICGGGAARGTELELLSFVNSHEHQRTMFCTHGSICTLLSVPKTEAAAGGIKKPIPRKLEPAAGLLILKYLVYLRSIHHTLACVCLCGQSVSEIATSEKESKEKKTSNIRDAFQFSFLVHRGKRVTADWITHCFRLTVHQLMGKDLMFNSYRHYIAFVGSNYVLPLALKQRSILMGMSDAELLAAWGREECMMYLCMLPVQHHFTLQAGHSIKTADGQYAVNPNSSASMPWDLMKKFFYVSEVWHQLLLSPRLADELLQLRTNNTGAGTTLNQTIIYPWILASPLKWETCAEQPCNGRTIACLDYILRVGFGLESFKSQEQREAVKAIIDGDTSKKNALVVLPTGGGKSIVAFFPVVRDLLHFHATSGLTVIISPLMSLRDSMILELLGHKNLAQPCCILWQDLWGSNDLINTFYNVPTVRTNCVFLFATPEATMEDGFRIFYTTMISMNKISRVVVDEAHNVICASSYRPAYSNLNFLLDRNLHCKSNVLDKSKSANVVVGRADGFESFNTTIDHNGKFGGGGAVESVYKKLKRTKKDIGAAAEKQESNIPCTLLSATIPVEGDFQNQLFAAMGLESMSIAVVRSKVVARPELTLGLKKVKAGPKDKVNLFEDVASAIVNFVVSSNQENLSQCHILIYVMGLQMGADLYKALVVKFSGTEELENSVRMFSGKMDKRLKDELIQWWFAGKNELNSFAKGHPAKIMVATTAFGEGLNHPAVGLVIHCGFSYSLINLFQEIGRAARSKTHVTTGYGLFLLDEKLYQSMCKNNGNKDDVDCEKLKEVFNGFVKANNCRWAVFGKHFDNSSEVTCSSIGCKILCDLCYNAERPSTDQHWSQKLCDAQMAATQLLALKSIISCNSLEQHELGDDFLSEWDMEKAFQLEQQQQQQFIEQSTTVTFSNTAPASTASLLLDQESLNFEAGSKLKLWMTQWIDQKKVSCVFCKTGSDMHSFDKCPSLNNRCKRCLKVGHFVKDCKMQKLVCPANLLCYRCYLPYNHYLGKFPQKLEFSGCAEQYLWPILMMDLSKHNGDANSFYSWYLNDATTWKDRFDYILTLCERLVNKK